MSTAVKALSLACVFSIISFTSGWARARPAVDSEYATLADPKSSLKEQDGTQGRVSAGRFAVKQIAVDAYSRPRGGSPESPEATNYEGDGQSFLQHIIPANDLRYPANPQRNNSGGKNFHLPVQGGVSIQTVLSHRDYASTRANSSLAGPQGQKGPLERLRQWWAGWLGSSATSTPAVPANPLPVPASPVKAEKTSKGTAQMPNLSPLNPQIQAFLNILNKLPPQYNEALAEKRAAYAAFAHAQAGVPLKVAHIENFEIPARDGHYRIPARLYAPVLDKPLPVVIYYHGGGWQSGSIETHDSICRYLSVYGECIIISVQWRLAPEHKFPVGVNDCMDAYLWVRQNVERLKGNLQRIALAGDSAGGNMVASVLLQLRDQGQPLPHFHALFYPSLDLSCSMPSYETFAEGYFLTTERVKHYIHVYLNKGDTVDNPYISPLKGDLTGLPPALVVTAEYDPLHDEGEAYAKKLKLSGIPATYKDCRGMIHAFLHMTGTVPAVRTILQDIGRILKENLA